MCIICVDLDKGKLTPWEAARNRREMLPLLDDNHIDELEDKINAALLVYLEDYKISEENPCGS